MRDIYPSSSTEFQKIAQDIQQLFEASGVTLESTLNTAWFKLIGRPDYATDLNMLTRLNVETLANNILATFSTNGEDLVAVNNSLYNALYDSEVGLNPPAPGVEPSAHIMNTDPNLLNKYGLFTIVGGRVTYEAPGPQLISGIVANPQSGTAPFSPTISIALTEILPGTANTIQWYKGVLGDTSTPVGNGLVTYKTEPLTPAGSYTFWVKVTNTKPDRRTWTDDSEMVIKVS